MNRICIIDIGTNSVLCLIAEKLENGTVSEKEQKVKSIGLGRYLSSRGELLKEGVDIVINIMNEWKKEIESSGIEQIIAVGTHVFRRALNGKEVSGRISERTGIPFEILNEEQEAFYGFLGATWGHKRGEKVLTIDVGGGSTEFVNGEEGSITNFTSIDLGVVSSTEIFLKNDPPAPGSMRKLRRYVFDKLSGLNKQEYCNPETVICMGGTATTLVALCLELEKYDGQLVTGTVLNRIQIEKWQKMLSGRNLNERKKLLKVYPDRADVIVAGTVILNCIMDYLNIDRFIISDRGLRFGIVLREFSGFTY